VIYEQDKNIMHICGNCALCYETICWRAAAKRA